MLTKSTNYTLQTDGPAVDIKVTPLFLQNHDQPWQPNEIYELSKVTTDEADPHHIAEPVSLGKIIVDDRMDWHYEGDHLLTEEEVEQVARFVLSQI